MLVPISMGRGVHGGVMIRMGQKELGCAVCGDKVDDEDSDPNACQKDGALDCGE